jgi:hypothetical protein
VLKRFDQRLTQLTQVQKIKVDLSQHCYERRISAAFLQPQQEIV